MTQFSLYRPTGAAFHPLRREMESLLDRVFTGSSQESGWQGVFPAVNLYENPDGYVLTAELPGVEPGEIQVSLEGSTVSLLGERKIDYALQEGASLHRRERQSGSFRRAFHLPVAIDADGVEAVHRHGVLLLRLPKAPEHKPRQISVQAK